MIKKLDCKDLECPLPVLKTKEAWESLEDDSMLDVELNSISSIENVKRFARKEGIYHKIKKLTNKITVITLVKGYECSLETKNDDKKLLTIIIGSIISALLASSCCLAPFLFLVFGVSMSSLTFLNYFAPYKSYFLVLSFILLAYLWFDYIKNRSKKLQCDTWLSKNYRYILIAGSFIAVIFVTYPYWVNFILE